MNGKERREHNTKRVGEAFRGNSWPLEKQSVTEIPRTATNVEPANKNVPASSPSPKEPHDYDSYKKQNPFGLNPFYPKTKPSEEKIYRKKKLEKAKKLKEIHPEPQYKNKRPDDEGYGKGMGGSSVPRKPKPSPKFPGAAAELKNPNKTPYGTYYL